MCDNNYNKIRNLQHERLKKEEDEEQWISGEELCTEGSSDEETATGKPKNKAKCKSKCHLQSKKPFKNVPDGTKAATHQISANLEGEVNKLDKTNPEKQLDPPIQWRPKRGSIKLPMAAEGERLDLS